MTQQKNHSHTNGYPHGHNSLPEKRLRQIFLFILAFAFVEIAGGLLSGSLALLSDAGHMLADSFAIFLSLFAFYISRKKSGISHSFGFYRAEILAAFINGILLVAYAVYIVFESIERFRSPVEINISLMFWVGLAGLAVNIISARILHPVSGDNLNARGAYLHILGDLLGSVAVIGGALMLHFFGWLWFDPLISLFISILIIFSAYNLVRETSRVLMEGSPLHIDPESVRSSLSRFSEILDVHDLHIWAITPAQPMLTAHLSLAAYLNGEQCNSLIDRANALIHDDFGIEHGTFQLEFPDSELICNNCEE